MKERHKSAAYGGEGWSPRTAAMREEIGSIWHSCGIDSEWGALKAVLLHRPGPELATTAEPDQIQMLDVVDAARAGRQHDEIARAFREHGVTVHYVDPDTVPPPNLMFVADLVFLTPAGAILGRPASTVRAGEERLIARRLADLGIPILRSISGTGTFEGADAAWLDERTVLLATGLRTNAEGAAQVESALREQGVEVIRVGLPYGAMHLMGELRFADRDLAIARPGRVPYAAVEALRAHGYRVLFTPDEGEVAGGMALNFVTLGPRKILMAAGNPVTQHFYESAGITCVPVEIDELARAAGGIGCLSGILERELVGRQ